LKVGPDRYRIVRRSAVVPPNSRELALERTNQSPYSCSNAWKHGQPARHGGRGTGVVDSIKTWFPR
jgi:hypothetical protein